MKKKWIVHIEQNGGEYTGWVTFYAENAIPVGMNEIEVDGHIMEFDEAVESLDLADADT